MKFPRFFSVVVLAALLVVAAPVLSSESTEGSFDTWDQVEQEWVDAELVEEASAAFAEFEAAPLGGVCKSSIGNGICQAESQCHGQVFSGLCAGNASIKCCVTQVGSAAHAAPAPATSALAAHACSSNGKAGLCLPVSSCSTGQTVSGLCPGNASIKCCIGATASSAAAPAPATAPVAGAKACSYQGKAGSCLPSSQCKGSTVSGLCPGSADIKCCLGATSSGAAPSLALAAASGSCSWAGKKGSCVDFRACQGTSFTGLCPGSANIRCCVPGPKSRTSRYVPQLTNPKPVPFIRRAKLRSASERMKLDEHKQKYDRFSRLHPNKVRRDGSDFDRFKSNRNSVIKLNDAFGTSNHPTPFGSKGPFANLSPREFRARYLRASHPNQRKHSNKASMSKKSVSLPRTANSAKPQLKTKGGSALLELRGDGGTAGWGGQIGKKSGKTGGESGDSAQKSGKTGGDSGDSAQKSGKTGGADGSDAEKSGKTGGSGEMTLDDSIQQYLPSWKKDSDDPTNGYSPFGSGRNHGFYSMENRESVKQSLIKANVPQVDVDATWAVLETFASQMSMPGWSDDQGICGSCWANAATQSAAQVSRLYYPYDTQASRVSVQQVLDCVKTANSNGCNGGTPMDALDWMASAKNLLASDDAYPRQEDKLTGPCQVQASSDIGANYKPRGWRFAVSPCATPLCENQQAKEIELLRRIYEEKVSVLVYVDASNWAAYDDGIFPTQLCSSSLEAGNHVVTLSVWGSPSTQPGYEKEPPYWRIVNSWGHEWGSQGEIYLPFGVNACGLANFAITAAPIPGVPIVNLDLDPNRWRGSDEDDASYAARIQKETVENAAKYKATHIPFPLTKSYF